MNFIRTVGLDSERAKSLHNQTVLIILVMLGKSWQHLQESVQLALADRLNNKFVIVAEEKEAATSSGTLASLEDLLAIEEGTQRLFEHLVVFKVLFKRVHEELTLMKCDEHISFQVDHLNLRAGRSCASQKRATSIENALAAAEDIASEDFVILYLMIKTP